MFWPHTSLGKANAYASTRCVCMHEEKGSTTYSFTEWWRNGVHERKVRDFVFKNAYIEQAILTAAISGAALEQYVGLKEKKKIFCHSRIEAQNSLSTHRDSKTRNEVCNVNYGTLSLLREWRCGWTPPTVCRRPSRSYGDCTYQVNELCTYTCFLCF